MKKKDLIKYLSSIEGNPEIVLFNSFVNDWQKVDKPKMGTLSKESHKLRLSWINYQRVKDGLPEISKEDYKAGLKNGSITKADYTLMTGSPYDQKIEVVVLQAKRRSKVSLDRLGVIEY